jgi:protein-arginine kinase activator protein McsA
MVAGFNLMNRRRSLIRRLDHLLEDAANEQFEEAAMVLRDALERLRMALVKDTLGLRDGGVER